MKRQNFHQTGQYDRIDGRIGDIRMIPIESGRVFIGRLMILLRHQVDTRWPDEIRGVSAAASDVMCQLRRVHRGWRSHVAITVNVVSNQEHGKSQSEGNPSDNAKSLCAFEFVDGLL